MATPVPLPISISRAIDKESSLYVGPITALHFLTNSLLIAGCGPALELWSLEDGSLLRGHQKALTTGPIHGLLVLKEQREEQHPYMLVYGGRECALVKIDNNHNIMIMATALLADRIINVSSILSKGCEGERLVLILAHCQVLLMNPLSLLIQHTCYAQMDALIYSAAICPYPDSRLLIAYGTVFSGVEIVELCGVDGGEEGRLEEPRLLPRMHLKGHEGSIFGLSYDISSGRLASVSDDRTIRIWDLFAEGEIITSQGKSQSATGKSSTSILEASTTNRPISAMSRSGPIIIPAPSNSPPLALLGHQSRIWRVQLIGDLLFSAAEDSSVRVWDVPRAECLAVLDGHMGLNIWSFAVWESAGLFVTGCDDCSIHLWNLYEILSRSDAGCDSSVPLEQLQLPSEHGEPKSFHISPLDGSILVHFNKGTLLQVSAKGEKCLVEGPQEALQRYTVMHCMDEQSIRLYGSLGGDVFVEFFKEGAGERRLVMRLQCGLQSKVTFLSAWPTDSDHQLILAQAGDGQVFLGEFCRSLAALKRSTLITQLKAIICSAVLLPSSLQVLCGTRDGRLVILSIDGTHKEMVKHSREAITCLHFIDQVHLLVTDRSGHLSGLLYSAPMCTLELLFRHRITKGWLEQVEVAVDGTIYVAGFLNKHFFVYDHTRQFQVSLLIAPIGLLVRTLYMVIRVMSGGAHRFWQLCLLSGSTSMLFSFIRRGHVYLYDSRKAQGIHHTRFHILKMPLHAYEIRAVCVLDRERGVFVTGSEDGRMMLACYDTSKDDMLTYLDATMAQPSGIKCISTAGGLVFTGGSSEMIQAWQYTGGRLRPIGHAIPSISVSREARIVGVDAVVKVGKGHLKDEKNEKDTILLAAAYSDSYVRCWQYVWGGNIPTLHFEMQAHPGHCCQKVLFLNPALDHGKAPVLLTAGTDGMVRAISLEDGRCASLSVHQSGINAIALHQSPLDHVFMLATGGDDGLLSVTIFDGVHFELRPHVRRDAAHWSTVTGVRFMEEEGRLELLSVGIDQRLRRWAIEPKEIRPLSTTQLSLADAGDMALLEKHAAIVGVGIEFVPLSTWKRSNKLCPLKRKDGRY